MRDYKGFINLDFPETPYSTYIIYSEDINDKSIYIGITEGYLSRAYKHSIDRKRKDHSNYPLYQWMNNVIDVQNKKVLFRVLEKEKYTEMEANFREMELVKQYRENGYIILNKTNGGKGFKGLSPWNKGKKMSKDYCKKLSKSHIGLSSGKKGKKLTNVQKENIRLGSLKRKIEGWKSPKRKTVYKYNNDNILLKEYECLQEAAKFENSNPTSIGEWCRGKKKPNNNFIWSYNKLIKENLNNLN